jgi:predicted Rossmann fold flavoprotein
MIESDICIIGAGPAGIMAAASAAQKAKKVIILESNTTAGRKLLLTGGGRCNLTHTGSPDEIIRAYKPFDRFVRHCIHEFSPQKLRDFFRRRSLETVVEQSGCVFPKTQNASDIQQILLEEMKKLNIKIFYGKKVKSIKKQKDLFTILSEKFEVSARSVIIATGGVSWPQTGSTGDGYKFAQSLGHKIIKPLAVVVPLITAEKFCSSLAGIGIPIVSISCPLRLSEASKVTNKKVSACGAMIFTHSGIGGPAVFDMSRNIADLLSGGLKISVDLLPDIKADELDKTIVDLFNQNPKRNIIPILSQFLPKALIQIICRENNIPEIAAGQLNKKLRKILVEKLKNFPFTVLRTESVEKATATRGGVDTTQIDPKTMQSKLCDGLFFAGEVINVDGPCGGYNLQFAFSSGFLAGKSAVELSGKIT